MDFSIKRILTLSFVLFVAQISWANPSMEYDYTQTLTKGQWEEILGQLSGWLDEPETYKFEIEVVTDEVLHHMHLDEIEGVDEGARTFLFDQLKNWDVPRLKRLKDFLFEGYKKYLSESPFHNRIAANLFIFSHAIDGALVEVQNASVDAVPRTTLDNFFSLFRYLQTEPGALQYTESRFQPSVFQLAHFVFSNLREDINISLSEQIRFEVLHASLDSSVMIALSPEVEQVIRILARVDQRIHALRLEMMEVIPQDIIEAMKVGTLHTNDLPRRFRKMYEKLTFLYSKAFPDAILAARHQADQLLKASTTSEGVKTNLKSITEPLKKLERAHQDFFLGVDHALRVDGYWNEWARSLFHEEMKETFTRDNQRKPKHHIVSRWERFKGLLKKGSACRVPSA